jgi:glutamyl-Q tRNA(Asp) synthetase
MAVKSGGRLLLRIEDIDLARCTREFERGIIDDLTWLGIAFDAPPQRQSEHVRRYTGALEVLESRGLIYPCTCSRADISRAAGGRCDPDGAPLHLGRCASPIGSAQTPGLRLDMQRARDASASTLCWLEYGEGETGKPELADPSAWGDVLLKRRDALASYHLAVVVDDDRQGVSDVVRGRDLYRATSIHRLLQHLLDLPSPRYRHHRLVSEAGGAKLAKRARSVALAQMRDRGVSARQIREMLGFGGQVSATPSQFAFAVTAAGADGIEFGAWEIS